MNVSEIRGVNLGGWLVLERWITPDLFLESEATDEYSLCSELGPRQAAQRLKDHRESFITEATIARIAELWLNTVRLPVGYWLFSDIPPFVAGASRYVDSLFDWAEKHGLSVILDVHAVPGSQNGWDHSGRAGEIEWHHHPDNIDTTLRFVSQLCERYGDRLGLLGVEVLNEPHWDVPLGVLMDYYERAYDIVRGKCSENVSVIFSDAFRPGEVSRELADREMKNSALDMHLYQLFTEEDRWLDLKGHLHKTTKVWPKAIQEVSSRLPVIVGEWSSALDESRGVYTDEEYQLYFQTQAETFESQGAGWVYWTARAHGGGPWSLLDHPEFITK